MSIKNNRRLRHTGAAVLLLLALPLLLPFFTGLLLARLGAALERRLRQRLSARLRRGFCLLFLCAAALGGLLGLSALLQALERRFPRLLASLQGGIAALERFYGTARFSPAVSEFFDRCGRTLLALLRLLRRLLPDAPGCIVVLLSALLFFRQREALRSQLPPALAARLDAAFSSLARMLRRWLRRSLPRLLAVYALSVLVLRVADVPEAAAAAVFLTLAEAFPPLGAGLLLLPAAFCAVLLSQQPLAFPLLLLYALIVLTRIGRKTAPRPSARRRLALLAAGYAGYRLGGLVGLGLALAVVALLAPAVQMCMPEPAAER